MIQTDDCGDLHDINRTMLALELDEPPPEDDEDAIVRRLVRRQYRRAALIGLLAQGSSRTPEGVTALACEIGDRMAEHET